MVFESRRGIGKVSSRSRRSMGLSYQSKQSRRRYMKQLVFKVSLIILGIGLLASAGVGIFMYKVAQGLPDVEQISIYIPNETTKIYSADGVVLAELHKEENRIMVPLSDISPSVRVAVVALEDNRFYKHHGVDFRAILRAVRRDVIEMQAAEGASTLTQQLARNVFLTKEKTITRKIAEVILALQIERRYTKEEILEMYLNQVYWGHNAYGIESASQLYFGKHAKELTIAESAMLVGLLRGPELYSPYKNMEYAVRRQEIVLNKLLEQDYITGEQYEGARQEKIELAGQRKKKYKAPFFTSYVIEQLIDMYGEDAVYSSGMEVYTSLDYRLQEYAEAAVAAGMEMGSKPFYHNGQKVPSANFTEAALLSINPRNGYILAMVGGDDFQENEYNKTIQAYRQSGSAFKPFTYLTALDRGLSPGSVIEDAPVTFNTIEGPYAPKNYTMDFLGPLSLRRALELSQNVVAIKLIDLIGPKSVIETAKKLGITSPLKNILSLALGACEVKMIDMVYAYGVFANAGVKAKPIAIERIKDRNGVEIYRNSVETHRVIDPNAVNALVDMMKGVVLYGTGRGAALPRPMAGKTGTTSDYRDAWFIGFVPQMVTATWVGNDNNAPMNYVTGGWMPALMWKDYMKNALQKIPVIDFPKPKGLIPVDICWDSGQRATDYCPENKVYTEKFWQQAIPQEECPVHRDAMVRKGRMRKSLDWLEEFFGEEMEGNTFRLE